MGIEATSILVVDDHPVVRAGIASIVETADDLELRAEAADAASALALCRTRDFDLAIVDVTLKDENGLELAKTIHERYPDIRILMISILDGAAVTPRSRKAGASGFVPKHASHEELLTAMRTVAAGNSYFP